MSEKLTPCPSCQAPISAKSEWCPSCGRKTPFYDFVIVKEPEEEIEEIEEIEELSEPDPAAMKKAESPKDRLMRFLLWTYLFIGLAILLIYCWFAENG